jgi:hypothetical protein
VTEEARAVQRTYLLLTLLTTLAASFIWREPLTCSMPG